jgi:hypothetical protein
LVLLEIGIVTGGDSANGVAEAKRGTTATIVASEKRILSGQAKLVLRVKLLPRMRQQGVMTVKDG